MKEEIMSLGRELWNNPEPGFFETKTHAVLARLFADAGFRVTDHGGMPGFSAVREGSRNTGRFILLADMDALPRPGTGEYIHSCGHHVQCTVMYGAARILAEKHPGALKDIVFTAVPAEEYIELERRAEYAESHGLGALSGKQELLRRGFFDSAEAVIATHAAGGKGRFITSVLCMSGFLVQTFTFRGTAAHAGAQPHLGRNTQNAAALFLQACAFLRETFDESMHIRIHPVMRPAEGQSVNLIPDYTFVETYVRASAFEAVEETASKLEAAAAGCAGALDVTCSVSRSAGYAPFGADPRLHNLARSKSEALGVYFVEEDFSSASSDMGDVSLVKPSIIIGLPGSNGLFHNPGFRILDEEDAYVFSSEFLADYLVSLVEGWLA